MVKILRDHHRTVMGTDKSHKLNKLVQQLNWFSCFAKLFQINLDSTVDIQVIGHTAHGDMADGDIHTMVDTVITNKTKNQVPNNPNNYLKIDQIPNRFLGYPYYRSYYPYGSYGNAFFV